jgi:ureidoacrylate peracid hydrolase
MAQHAPATGDAIRRFAAPDWWTVDSDRYDPSTTAVVVVDVQNDFCHAEGALARRGADTSGGRAIVAAAQRLLDAARAAGALVVFVGTFQDRDTESQTWLNRNAHQPVHSLSSGVCADGEWGSGWFGLQPSDGDVVVRKWRYSAFAGTNLDLILRSRGIRSLLFAGVATNICVESSLRDGLFADYYVSIVEDACAAFTAAAHEASVAGIGASFGTVVDVDGLARLWKTHKTE